MADAFVELDVSVDSEELSDEQFEYMEENIAGWQPAAANLDTLVLEDGARLGSEVGAIAVVVGTEVWRTYGEKIARLLPLDPTAATVTSTWTLGDADGHTIDGGLTVDVDGQGFSVVDDVIVPPGEVVGSVDLVAVDEGDAGSGLTGDDISIAEVVDYEAVIVLDAPTEGGFDGETDDEYLDRLAQNEELSAPRPLKAIDVQRFARRTLGVERVLVLDNYRPPAAPGGEAEDVPLTFTVCPIDTSGQAAGAGARAAYLLDLRTERGTNWNIWDINPTYNVIDVNFEGTVHSGFDPAEVQAAAIDAITTFLLPEQWGQPQFGDERLWVQVDEVRHRELATVLNNIEGLDDLTLLEFGLSGNPLTENVDVPLDGKAPLTQPGDITGTVS